MLLWLYTNNTLPCYQQSRCHGDDEAYISSNVFLFNTSVLSLLCSFHYDLFIPTHIMANWFNSLCLFQPGTAMQRDTLKNECFFSLFCCCCCFSGWLVRRKGSALSQSHFIASAKVDNWHFVFSLSITFICITVSLRATALILKSQTSGFVKKQWMIIVLTFQPTMQQWWKKIFQWEGCHSPHL